MCARERRALIVGGRKILLPQVAALMDRASIDAHYPADGLAGLGLLRELPYNLVIVKIPTPGVELADFVATLRSAKSRSRRAGLLVTAGEEHRVEVESFLGHGVNRFVPGRASAAEWLYALADLFDVPPRLSVRALVQLEALVKGSRHRSLAQTQDVSSTGMFVRGNPHPFSVGTEIDFELNLPDDPSPLRGVAEVVRHANIDLEQIDGFGARFRTLASSGAQRLQQFLARISHRLSS